MARSRSALVVGSSGGIGAALVQQLREGGWEVQTWSRSEDGLDITDESSVAEAAASLGADGRRFDWIIVASGVLGVEGVGPERAFRELDPVVMAQAYAVNTIGPALLLKHLAPLLYRGRPVAFAALSARLGSIGDNGLGGWMSYRASKAALNQVVRCAAIEIRRKRPEAVVVALHPGTVETELTRAYARGRYTASPRESAAQLVGVIEGLSPEQTGGFFDYAGATIPY